MTTLKAETLRALADEYRLTMPVEVLHLWAVDVRAALLALLEADKDERVAALEAENARASVQYSDPPTDRRFLAKIVANGFEEQNREWGPIGRKWVEACWIEEQHRWALWNGEGRGGNEPRIEIMAWAELPFEIARRALGKDQA